jgi:FAD synthetase
MSFSKSHKLGYIIMGSRNDDPHCEHLDHLTESDVEKGYPNFKRVNPIVRWNYYQVWEAIKTLDIPYCSLYE